MPFVVLLSAVFIVAYCQGYPQYDNRPFGDVIAEGRAGNIERIEVRGPDLIVHLRGNRPTFYSKVGANTDVASVLQQSGITVGNGDSGTVRLDFYDRYAKWEVFLWFLLVLTAFGVVVYFVILATRAIVRGGKTA